MTVGELIAELEKYPKDMGVIIHYEDYAYAGIQYVDGPADGEEDPCVEIVHSNTWWRGDKEEAGDGEA